MIGAGGGEWDAAFLLVRERERGREIEFGGEKFEAHELVGEAGYPEFELEPLHHLPPDLHPPFLAPIASLPLQIREQVAAGPFIKAVEFDSLR